ncbi:glycosyltransferase family 2 protein [bacterium]|nr:glycosyltransferase family 2 protein [bacterium]
MAKKSHNTRKLPISGCVITYNEERNVGDCLESLSFCEDVVVVDSFSTDRTIEISRQYTSRIYERKYEGNISQKNFTLGKVKYDWVLSLDADERVSPALRDEIAEEFARGFDDLSGYVIKRHVFYLGKWINHCGWYPDYKLRLFNRKKGHFSGLEPHDTVITNGKVRKLKGEIHHFPCANLSEHLKTVDKYSTITAASLPNCSIPAAVPLLVVAPIVKFLEMYIIKGGLFDGVHGLIICAISAFSRFLRYAKAIEMRLSKEGTGQ